MSTDSTTGTNNVSAKGAANGANASGTVKLKTVAQAYTFKKDGLPLIRKALITFGIVLALSVLMVAGSRFLLLRIEPEKAKAQALQNTAREKFKQAELEHVELREFLPKFTQLRAQGFYGPENRLRMLELIKSIQERWHLLPINYEFAPQQLMPLDPILLATTQELHVTRIALHFGLLHTLDLFHFLRDLRAQGFYTTKECTIKAANRVSNDTLDARLNTDCVLYWVTIDDVAAANNFATAPQ